MKTYTKKKTNQNTNDIFAKISVDLNEKLEKEGSDEMLCGYKLVCIKCNKKKKH